MRGSNPIHTPVVFFLLTFFISTSFKLSYCIRNNGSIIFCPEIEKQSLLSFKQSLEDRYDQLSSWQGKTNCCKWDGVVCHNLTGRVHELHVHSSGGKLNPSLLNLKHLRYLDLSQNDFTGETIPSFIGSLAKLEYLNLSDAGFQGMIPPTIANLSNLHTLDLADDRHLLEVDSLEWLSGLLELEYVNMNGVDLSRASNWAEQVINTLPSLLELHLSGCRLDFVSPLDDVNISSSLKSLDLSENNFESLAIPRWIFRLRNLRFLDLSFNYFQGPIPTISNATKLQYIDLSSNYLNSSIPNWIYFCKDLEFVNLRNNLLQGTISNAVSNLTSVKRLDLSLNQLSGVIPKEISNLCEIKLLHLAFNNLRGEISDSFASMSECFLANLEFLCVQSNQLSGHLIENFGEFTRLKYLGLGTNSLSGAIPSSLGKLLSLEILRLDGNKFTGSLPESLGQLFSLEVLSFANNMLEGIVNESHLTNLTKLESLSASGNHLTLNVSPIWIAPFQLTTLRLGSWNLGSSSRIPSWLEMQKNISELDLSDTGISGNVPSWFWQVQFLNLSHNHLRFKIPYIRSTKYVYLHSNRFSGPLPRIAGTMRELDLSNNLFSGGISHFLCDKTYETYDLQILHLGGNQLSGELPSCWMKWPFLKFFILGNNHMSGSIPNSIGHLANLVSLNLYDNKFAGQIPSSMQNCTELMKIDVADNDLDGNIPTWMGTSLVKLRILILRANKLSGEIPLEICHLNSLQILDLSDNKISGMIPRCVYNFTAMTTRKRSLLEDDFYKYGTGILEGPSFIDMLFYKKGSSKEKSFLENTSIIIKERSFQERVFVTIKGHRLQYDTILTMVTNMDLSKNNLSGDIPRELTSLVELQSLNLSQNHLTGLIPGSIGDMKQLESLDLSRNYLSGQIPNNFTLMSFLSYLNLSYNNLMGRIPESTQLLGFEASSFLGNDLCGPPLTSTCSHDDVDEVHRHKDDNEGDEYEREWLYVFISLGYAVGHSVVCTTLLLKKSWREAYFGFLEYIWNKLYVCTYIIWKKLTKPSGPSL